MIPRIWQDYPVVCIASGPSLTDADIEIVRKARLADKCRVIAVNNNYERAPWADHLHVCDKQFFKWNEANEAFTKTPIPVVTTISNELEQFMIDMGVKRLTLGAGFGLIVGDDHTIAGGGSSGYQAINIAALYGSKRIFLLGYDCKETGGKTHWFGNHPVPTNPEVFKIQIKNYKSLPPVLEKHSISVINCTRDTALDMFPRMAIDAALNGS